MSTTLAAAIPAQTEPHRSPAKSVSPVAVFTSPFSHPCRPGIGTGLSSAVVAEMADFALRSRNETTALRLLCALASRVSGSETVSITAVFGCGDLRTVASTDRRAVGLDRLQYGLGVGPCVATLSDQQIRCVEDLATDQQWPRWAEPAMARGLSSALSVPLSSRGGRSSAPFRSRAFGTSGSSTPPGSPERLGSVNVYSFRPRRFARDDIERLRAVAVRIAVVVDRYRRQQARWRAVDARTVVALAAEGHREQYGITQAEAPTTLLRAQRRDDTGVYVQAENAVRRRRLPGLTTLDPSSTDCWRA